jgi:hypothetical protein
MGARDRPRLAGEGVAMSKSGGAGRQGPALKFKGCQHTWRPARRFLTKAFRTSRRRSDRPSARPAWACGTTQVVASSRSRAPHPSSAKERPRRSTGRSDLGRAPRLRENPEPALGLPSPEVAYLRPQAPLPSPPTRRLARASPGGRDDRDIGRNSLSCQAEFSVHPDAQQLVDGATGISPEMAIPACPKPSAAARRSGSACRCTTTSPRRCGRRTRSRSGAWRRLELRRDTGHRSRRAIPRSAVRSNTL